MVGYLIDPYMMLLFELIEEFARISLFIYLAVPLSWTSWIFLLLEMIQKFSCVSYLWKLWLIQKHVWKTGRITKGTKKGELSTESKTLGFEVKPGGK